MVENIGRMIILCRYSLVFECISFDFISPNMKSLICKQQQGFVKLISTVTQIIHFLDKVYDIWDDCFFALSAYFDIGKAFDTVPHHLLLSKFQALDCCLVLYYFLSVIFLIAYIASM